jgi:hypothetical protein
MIGAVVGERSHVRGNLLGEAAVCGIPRAVLGCLQGDDGTELFGEWTRLSDQDQTRSVIRAGTTDFAFSVKTDTCAHGSNAL